MVDVNLLWKLPEVQEALQKAKDLIAKGIEYAKSQTPPSHKLKDTGILMAPLSHKYSPTAYVTIMMLRSKGYKGPIQIWQRDIDPIPSLFSELPGVEVRTYSDDPGCAIHPDDYMFSRTHWMCRHRIRAILECELRNVFVLGADCYPITDVTPWFSHLEKTGNVLWQDHTTGDRWHPFVYNLPEETRHTTFTVQGDSLLLDVKRMWHVIRLVGWLNDRSEFYYPFGCGDQTQWRAALELLKVPIYRFSPERVVNIGQIFYHQCPEGKIGMVHRTSSKWLMGEKLPTKYVNVPCEDEAWGYYHDFCQRYSAQEKTDSVGVCVSR